MADLRQPIPPSFPPPGQPPLVLYGSRRESLSANGLCHQGHEVSVSGSSATATRGRPGRRPPLCAFIHSSVLRRRGPLSSFLLERFSTEKSTNRPLCTF